MRVFKRVKKRKRVAILMTWVEEDYFVARRIVVFLVACEEHVGAQIWKHLANTMNKDVGMFIAIVGIDVFVNLMTYETDKVVRVCLGCEFSGHHVGMHLVLLKGVLQQ